jgi:iron complex transport system substrate-binding protein
MKNIWIGCLIVLLGISCNNSADKTAEGNKQTTAEAVNTDRIISLNGTITECLYTFGLGDKIVGVDITSTFPNEAKSLTNLGHVSKLNVEAIINLNPTALLIDEQNKNNPVIKQLEDSGIDIHSIEIPQNLEGPIKIAKQLEAVFKTVFDTKDLEATIAANIDSIQRLIASFDKKPKTLFIYARGAQMMMVAGRNTFAEKMVNLAGGAYLIDAFESFKPLNAETLLQYQPDCILMFESGLKSLTDEDKDKQAQDILFSMNGLDQTTAGKNKNIITMEGLYLSGFGPRSSKAALELAMGFKKINLAM